MLDFFFHFVLHNKFTMSGNGCARWFRWLSHSLGRLGQSGVNKKWKRAFVDARARARVECGHIEMESIEHYIQATAQHILACVKWTITLHEYLMLPERAMYSHLQSDEKCEKFMCDIQCVPAERRRHSINIPFALSLLLLSSNLNLNRK